MGAVEGYIFDFDGTLGRIPVDWDGVKQGLRMATGQDFEFTHLFSTLETLFENSPELIGPAFVVLDEFETAAAPMAHLYEGSAALLSKLSATAKVTLVTMQGARACAFILERFGLRQYLLKWFTREDSLDRAEQLRLALEEMRVPKEAAMFVGDRVNDLDAAKAVGIPFTMVRTHGADPAEDIPIFHSLEEFSASLS